MEKEDIKYSVSLMSEVLGVSRSGYYKWKHSLESERKKKREKVKRSLEKTYYQYKARYGAPRLSLELNAEGINCCKNHVAKLLKELGLKARNGKNFKYSGSGESMRNVKANLLKRKFKADRPNEKWTTDITYIWLHGKWLYLAVVMDLYSRAIVGWSLDKDMTETLVSEALSMALSRRTINEAMIVHSDRGVQYRSNGYQQKLLSEGCKISMSRKSNCWDNAAMESFFSRMKVELIYAERFESFEEAKMAIFEYIEIFYNRERRHSAIGYISPMAYEQLSV